MNNRPVGKAALTHWLYFNISRSVRHFGVVNAGWHASAHRYAEFLRRHEGRKVLLLELGVGYNTPGIIKYPFWQMTAQNPGAVYVCLNQGQAACPAEISKQSICLDADIGGLLQLTQKAVLPNAAGA